MVDEDAVVLCDGDLLAPTLLNVPPTITAFGDCANDDMWSKTPCAASLAISRSAHRFGAVECIDEVG